MTVQQGQVVILPCKAEGHPKPEITWYKDQQLVTLTDYRSIINDGSLRLVVFEILFYLFLKFCLSMYNVQMIQLLNNDYE